MDRKKDLEDSSDPFSVKETPGQFKDNFSECTKSSQTPPGPPSDSSELDSDSEPRKLPTIPPCYSKQPFAVSDATKSKLKPYHFDLVLLQLIATFFKNLQ
jgi:hypothetical protein